MKKRILPLLVTWAVMTVCTVISLTAQINVPVINIIGSYLSALMIAVVLYKFPYGFYLWALFFDIMATSFGSVLNFYRTVGFYDKAVHFLSGVIAAAAGKLIIDHLLKNSSFPRQKTVTVLFTLFFALSCAGLWEVYEFSMDRLIDTSMQGNAFDTMTDIIAGMGGGLLYCLPLALKGKGQSQKI